MSPDRAQRSTHDQASANAPTLLGPAWHSRRPHQRHCGTGIWRDRDIAAGWRYLDPPCASLPTRSRNLPRTAARKAGVLDPRKQLGERDGLSAGGKWIRTIGPPVTCELVGAARRSACEGVGAVQRDFFCSACYSIEPGVDRRYQTALMPTTAPRVPSRRGLAGHSTLLRMGSPCFGVRWQLRSGLSFNNWRPKQTRNRRT